MARFFMLNEQEVPFGFENAVMNRTDGGRSFVP